MPDVTAPSRSARAPASPDPLRAEIAAALNRAHPFFEDRTTRAGLVGRRLMGRPASGDPDLADHLIRAHRRRSSMDGGIGGSLVDTARAAWEVLDLGAPMDHAAVVRFTGFLLNRQDAPGRWGEADGRGTGYFSPGPIDQPIAPLTLTTGVVLNDEADARFAASCVALRSVLRAGLDARAGVRAHVESLLALDDVSPTLLAVVVGTLGLASPEFSGRVAQRVEAFVARQDADGTWAEIPQLHAMEALSTIPTPAARRAIRRGTRAVIALQEDSGAFDPSGSEGLALVAVRALATARAALH